MASVEDLDQVIERYQRALNELLKGNPEPNKTMFGITPRWRTISSYATAISSIVACS